MIKIFISYIRQDFQKYIEIKNALLPAASKGFLQIWSDSDIQPGEPFEATIENIIKTSDIFIILLSQQYLKSEYISTRELDLILKQHSERHSQIHCIRLSNVELPENLQFLSVSPPLDSLSDKEKIKVIGDVVNGIISTFPINTISSFPTSGDFFRDASNVASGVTGGYNDINISGAFNIFTDAEHKLGLEGNDAERK